MNELDLWLSFDALEPACVGTLFDALGERLAPLDEEAQARAVGRVLDALDAALGSSSGGEAERLAEAPVGSPAVEVARRTRLRAEEPEQVEVAAIAAASANVAVESAATEGKGAAPLAGTAMALELPAAVWESRGRLPFRPASPDAPRRVKTMQVPVMQTGLGDTAPLGDDSIARAVAAVPFLGNTIGTGTVPFPRLSVMAYARFCVEMRFWPEQEADIFLRYRVMHRAAREAMDTHWAEVLSTGTGERAAFERAAGEYVAALRAMWGQS